MVIWATRDASLSLSPYFISDVAIVSFSLTIGIKFKLLIVWLYYTARQQQAAGTHQAHHTPGGTPTKRHRYIKIKDNTKNQARGKGKLASWQARNNAFILTINIFTWNLVFSAICIVLLNFPSVINGQTGPYRRRSTNTWW